MSREGMLMILGALVALLPFLGIPSAWFMVLLPVLGLCILGLALSLRARLQQAPKSTVLPIHESEPPVI